MFYDFGGFSYVENPFSGLKKREWFLWGMSLLVVAVSNFLTGSVRPVLLIATLVGVTALILSRAATFGGRC